jgi:hypothetical protein
VSRLSYRTQRVTIGFVAKLVLLSSVIAMFAIPLLAGRARSARRGLRKMILLMVAFNLFYVLALRYIYPHLL